jgi:phospholipase/carboxylesterase
MRLIEKIIGPTNGRAQHSATVIFFHGSGDTSHGVLEWIRFLLGRDLKLAHAKFIFPTGN